MSFGLLDVNLYVSIGFTVYVKRTWMLVSMCACEPHIYVWM
jgi:hypothetical protein